VTLFGNKNLGYSTGFVGPNWAIELTLRPCDWKHVRSRKGYAPWAAEGSQSYFDCGSRNSSPGRVNGSFGWIYSLDPTVHCRSCHQPYCLRLEAELVWPMQQGMTLKCRF